MKAALYNAYGGPDVLYQGETPMPHRKADEILVRVHAASVNAIDVTVRSGALKLFTGRNFPRGTGLDFSGEVVETSGSDQSFLKGDLVWGCLPHGALGSAAEYVCVSPEQLALIPETLDTKMAAALPAVGVTSIVALRDVAKLKSGESLLVRGGSGGVGSIAVQLGRAMGARVSALARFDQLDEVRKLGASEVFDYAVTTPQCLGKFDVILDTVGSDTWSYRALLTRKGRMVTICPDAKHPLGSFLRIFASFIFGSRRVRFFSTKPKTGTLTSLAAYVQEGAIVPIVETMYPLSDIARAHRALEAGGRRGKQVIRLI